MKRLFQLSHISAGFTAILIGYTGSAIIVIHAANAAGATPDQISAWFLALGLGMAVTTIGYSWFYKTPILTAWSTPGIAMLVEAVTDYTLTETVGAFILSALFIFITGLVRPINRMLTEISPQISTAMLAAILLPFCLGAFEAITVEPITFAVMFACYLIAKRYMPRYSMLILLITAIGFSLQQSFFANLSISLYPTTPVWITPEFDLQAAINLSLPLYIITMLSQNLPGLAMLSSHNYRVKPQPILLGSGAANLLLAPFGCITINLAAISAAICMSEEADSDPNQRYKATIWAGIFYLFAGIWAASVVSIFLALPKEISHILAGFALLGTLLMCLSTAFTSDKAKESALFTFLIALSGISLFGISAPVLGLVIGIAHYKYFKQVRR